MTPFTAFIPLGPTRIEYERVIDLVKSLVYFEPHLQLLIIVVDGYFEPSIIEDLDLPRTCHLATLPHPRPNNELNMLGGLCAADLTALRYADQFGVGAFVVKLDTDSLVIGPFSERVDLAIRARPCSGTIGTLGTSSNRETCSFHLDQEIADNTGLALQIGLGRRALSGAEIQFLRSWGVHTPEQLASFREVCNLLAPVLDRPFKGAHCQGGAYAISKTMVSRLSAGGLFRNPSLWLDLRLGEDQMMGILSELVGLKAEDFSDLGEVFGVQSRGLPYPPSQLLAHGYSIIHSVKNNNNLPEEHIRSFFRSRRRDDT